MLHNGGNGSILVMLDETRLHWKLINFGVLLRSFLGGEGGRGSFSFVRTRSFSPPLPPDVRSDVGNFSDSVLRRC